MWIQYLLQLLSDSAHTICHRSRPATFESRPWLTFTHLATTADDLISIIMNNDTDTAELMASKTLLGRSEDFLG